MNYREAKKALRDQFLTVFPAERFKNNTSGDGVEFWNHDGERKLSFVQGVNNNRTNYDVSFCLSLGFESICNVIKHSLQDDDYSNGPTTFSITYTDYLGEVKGLKIGMHNYNFSNSEEIGPWVKEVEVFLKEYGYPEFWDRFTTLESVDTYINSNPYKSLLFHDHIAFYSRYGIIAAKLVNNPALSDLIEIYRKRLEPQTDLYKANYEKVVTFITSHTRDELLEIGKTRYSKPA